MSVSPSQSADYYLSLAVSLASEFAIDAVERDHQGGTPKLARDRLRQSAYTPPPMGLADRDYTRAQGGTSIGGGASPGFHCKLRTRTSPAFAGSM